MGIIKDYIRETFIGTQSDDPFVVDEVPEPGGHGTAVVRRREKQEDPERIARVRIVIFCNRAIGVALFMCMVFVFIFSFKHPDRNVPDTVSRIMWACLGYLGSTVTIFFGKKPRETSK